VTVNTCNIVTSKNPEYQPITSQCLKYLVQRPQFYSILLPPIMTSNTSNDTILWLRSFSYFIVLILIKNHLLSIYISIYLSIYLPTYIYIYIYIYSFKGNKKPHSKVQGEILPNISSQCVD